MPLTYTCSLHLPINEPYDAPKPPQTGTLSRLTGEGSASGRRLSGEGPGPGPPLALPGKVPFTLPGKRPRWVERKVPPAGPTASLTTVTMCHIFIHPFHHHPTLTTNIHLDTILWHVQVGTTSQRSSVLYIPTIEYVYPPLRRTSSCQNHVRLFILCSIHYSADSVVEYFTRFGHFLPALLYRDSSPIPCP